MQQTFGIVENGQVRDMTEEEIAYCLSLEEQSEVDELL